MRSVTYPDRFGLPHRGTQRELARGVGGFARPRVDLGSLLEPQPSARSRRFGCGCRWSCSGRDSTRSPIPAIPQPLLFCALSRVAARQLQWGLFGAFSPSHERGASRVAGEFAKRQDDASITSHPCPVCPSPSTLIVRCADEQESLTPSEKGIPLPDTPNLTLSENNLGSFAKCQHAKIYGHQVPPLRSTVPAARLVPLCGPLHCLCLPTLRCRTSSTVCTP